MRISWGGTHLVLPLHVPGSLQVLLQQRPGGVFVARPQGRAQQTLHMDQELSEEACIHTARDVLQYLAKLAASGQQADWDSA